MSIFGIAQLPIWGIYEIFQQRKTTICDKISAASKPKPDWGPSNPAFKEQYDRERNMETFTANHRV